jgi:blue light- and temperature-responsive anti-repressor
MSQLFRLVYYSRNLIPGSANDVVAEVRQILATSRRNNATCGVTGALMFNSGCFAQVLEGSRQAIEQTFERIQRDSRHNQVTVLEYGKIDRAAFPAWSMAFVGENMQDRDLFGVIGSESGFDSKHLTAAAVFETVERLVREEEALAA